MRYKAKYVKNNRGTASRSCKVEIKCSFLIIIFVTVLLLLVFLISPITCNLNPAQNDQNTQNNNRIVLQDDLLELISGSDTIESAGLTRGSEQNLESRKSQWDSEVIWSGPDKLSGVTIGDLDTTRKGNEVIGADGEGRVIMAYQVSDGSWDSIELWQGEGELITPVIGEFYSGHDGNELLVVGMAKGPEGEGAGQATMIYGAGDNWKSAVIFTNEDSMLHGAAVGDLDPAHSGNEVILMSFGYDVKMLTWNGTDETSWTATQMWHAEGKVRKGIIDDVDPTHKGNELVVVDKSGNCTMLYGSGTSWTAETLWTDPGSPGLARIAVGDADASYPGKEIVVGGDSNNVGIIRRTGDIWSGEVIFTDSDKIRGLGISDVDPTYMGNEVLVFSYSFDVNLLSKTGSSWNSRVIFTDTGRSHDLAVGEFDSTHPGPEVVIAGYSNKLTMLGVSSWFYDIMLSGPNKLSGVTIGDLDPTRQGNEVIGIDGVGKVILIHRSKSGTWDSIELWQGEGELITPVIGNFYDGHEGNELLVVGMAKGPEGEGAGQATMIFGSGNNWEAHIIFINADSMLHGAAVGDLDPTRDGNEVIVMSFGYDVKMLTWNGSGAGPTEWTATQMWHAEGKVRKGIIDDIDPTHTGNELVVVDKSGNCTMLYGSGTNWTAQTLFTDNNPPGLARVAVGDADPTYSGKEMVVGGDSNNVGIIWREGSSWQGEVIFTDSDKIRGVGISDVDPSHPDNEIVVFGYSNKVTLLTKTGTTWDSKVIFIDTGRAHDLAIGEFDSDHAGQEIVIGGYSNNVTMIMNIELEEAQDISLYAYPSSQLADSSDSVEFTIGVLGIGGFNQLVKFSLDTVPSWLSHSFYPEAIIPDSSTTLTLTIPATKDNSDNKLVVNVSSGDIFQTIELQLNILGDTTAPSIESTIPVNDAEGIPTSSPIVIRFSEPMDKNTITTAAISIIQDDTGQEYAGNLEYIEKSNVLIITNIIEDLGAEARTPQLLPSSKLIKVSVGTSITDLAGNNLASKYDFKFITSTEDEPATGNPDVKSFYPAKDGKAISVLTPVIVEFTIPINSSTLNWNNIEITSIGGGKYTGMISYDPNTLILTISDIKLDSTSGTSGLPDDSKITVTLKSDIISETGEPLSEPLVWSFDTGTSDTDGDGDEDDEDDHSDEFEEERNMYVLVMILLIIIIIITLLACFARVKGKATNEGEDIEKSDEEERDERVELDEEETDESIEEDEYSEEPDDEPEPKHNHTKPKRTKSNHRLKPKSKSRRSDEFKMKKKK